MTFSQMSKLWNHRLGNFIWASEQHSTHVLFGILQNLHNHHDDDLNLKLSYEPRLCYWLGFNSVSLGWDTIPSSSNLVQIEQRHQYTAEESDKSELSRTTWKVSSNFDIYVVKRESDRVVKDKMKSIF